MQDDFDNRMGIPDEELAGESATPVPGDRSGGVEEIDAEVVIIEAVGRPSGAARARSASPRKAAPAAKKPARKAAKKAKPARKVAKKAAKKAKPAKKAARKAAKKASKKAARKPARKAGKKK